MTSDYLKLNDNKTEVITVKTKAKRRKLLTRYTVSSQIVESKIVGKALVFTLILK